MEQHQPISHTGEFRAPVPRTDILQLKGVRRGEKGEGEQSLEFAA